MLSSAPSISFSPLSFVGLFAAAFLFGVLNYAVIMLTRDKVQDFLLVVFLLLVAAPICYVPKVALPAAVAISLLCVVPAMLERRMAGAHLFGWSYHLWRLGAATYQSFVVGTYLVFLSAYYSQLPMPRELSLAAYSVGVWLKLIPNFLWLDIDDSLEKAIRITFLLGLVTTPPAISILRWVFYTSKMRPGLDRPLSSSERLAEEQISRYSAH